LDKTKARVEKLEKVLPEVRNLREELSKLLSKEA
jgi:hypothetical protein